MDVNTASKSSVIAAVVMYVIALLVAVLYQLSATLEPSELNWIIITLGLCGGHIALSFTIINERRLGGMFCLGREIGDLGSGPWFAFWPIIYIRTETRNIVQIEIGVLTPEEREKAKALGPSVSVFLMEEPLRVNWGDINSANPPANKEERDRFKGNPYADEMVTDTHITIRLQICSLTDLIRQAGSLSEGIELLKQLAISRLIEQAGKSFVARALYNMESINDELQRALEEFVVDPDLEHRYVQNRAKSWGINILRTQITRMGTARRVNEAIANKGKVIFHAQGERVRLQEEGAGKAEATRLQALADRIRLAEEGAGKAEAETLLYYARTKGIRSLSKMAGTTAGQFIMQLDAFKEGIKEGKPIVIPMEFTRILGALGEKLTPPTTPRP